MFKSLLSVSAFVLQISAQVFQRVSEQELSTFNLVNAARMNTVVFSNVFGVRPSCPFRFNSPPSFWNANLYSKARANALYIAQKPNCWSTSTCTCSAVNLNCEIQHAYVIGGHQNDVFAASF